MATVWLDGPVERDVRADQWRRRPGEEGPACCQSMVEVRAIDRLSEGQSRPRSHIFVQQFLAQVADLRDGDRGRAATCREPAWRRIS